jgi:hypothetical protein
MVIAFMGLTSSVMSRSGARYQPEPNPVQPILLTTDPTGCRPARLPNLPRNLAATRQLVRPQPGNQCCHISPDALLRIDRNTAETKIADYQ